MSGNGTRRAKKQGRASKKQMKKLGYRAQISMLSNDETVESFIRESSLGNEVGYELGQVLPNPDDKKHPTMWRLGEKFSVKLLNGMFVHASPRGMVKLPRRAARSGMPPTTIREGTYVLVADVMGDHRTFKIEAVLSHGQASRAFAALGQNFNAWEGTRAENMGFAFNRGSEEAADIEARAATLGGLNVSRARARKQSGPPIAAPVGFNLEAAAASTSSSSEKPTMEQLEAARAAAIYQAKRTRKAARRAARAAAGGSEASGSSSSSRSSSSNRASRRSPGRPAAAPVPALGSGSSNSSSGFSLASGNRWSVVNGAGGGAARFWY